jgi:hypothetical protein
MLCDAVRAVRLMMLAKTGELGSAEWHWVQAHLNQCASCQDWWHREELWDTRLQQSMLAVPVPEDLPQRIASRLSWTKRQWQTRRLVKWALAASVLLAVAIAWLSYWFLAYPTLDLAALSGPVPIPEHPTAENVGRLLEQYGVYIPTELKQRWDFQYLKAIYFSYEQGRFLCNLEFRREDSGAQVVVKLVPRRWCRTDQLEALRYTPGMNVLGIEESGPYVALVVGDPNHIASFYCPSPPAS